MDDRRYLNLDGSDVFAFVPDNKLQSVFQKAVGAVKRPEIGIPLGVIFGYAAIAPNSSNELAKLLGSAAIDITLLYLLEKIVIKDTFSSNACFDKEAQKSVTKPINFNRASYLSKVTLAIGCLNLSLGVVMHDDYETFRGAAEFMARNIFSFGLLASHKRFSNVVSGKWNIVDEPPKRERMPKRQSKVVLNPT